MLRINFFLSGTVLSASITYILLLQIRSTTHMITKSLKHLSHQLKNQDDPSKSIWIPAMPSAGLLETIKEGWNNSLRSATLWIQEIDDTNMDKF
ncbi:hypothetical protein PCK1_001727 [Pneumocystis canis]|nr:hypothetical protein PCK1_001727 [Pneumocystis canis]